MGSNQFAQSAAIGSVLSTRNDDRPATIEWEEKFEHGDVERFRGDGEQDIVGFESRTYRDGREHIR
jgi:hypothetical protein